MIASASATVLVVDDDESIGDLMVRIFECLGHAAVLVPNGQGALEYLRDSHPDAMLLDYMMPGMDGLEVLRAVRSDPRTHDLPVIMFSAYGDARLIEAAMREGANDYWVKTNVNVEEIGSRLSKCLPPVN